MPPKCPMCNQETSLERSIQGGRIATDYFCNDCRIVWFTGEDKKMHIGVSSTHSKASKLNDEEFENLVKRITDYERQ